MSWNDCDNVNLWYLTTEVTVVLISRPTYNSQLDVHVERIKLPKYTTTRDLGRETNGRAVVACRNPYTIVWRYKSLLEE